jgi:hypothetical protein
MKPEDYRETCTVTSDIHYEVREGVIQGPHASSGTLHKGRVVWLQKDPQQSNTDSLVSAYAEGVGIVLLDPRCLVHEC